MHPPYAIMIEGLEGKEKPLRRASFEFFLPRTERFQFSKDADGADFFFGKRKRVVDFIVDELIG